MKFKINGVEVDTESGTFQADVDTASQKGIDTAVTEATTTLSTKNTELIGELKTARKAVTPEAELLRLQKIETD